MAETYWTTAGQRAIDITINGVVRGSKIDPFMAANGRFLPSYYTYSAQAAASFGGIQVTFTATIDQPSVAAIEVYELSSLTAPPANPAPASPAPASPASPIPTPSPSPTPTPSTSPNPVAVTPGVCPNQPANSSVVARVNCGKLELVTDSMCCLAGKAAAKKLGLTSTSGWAMTCLV
jgi:hypothetical protein